jgi:hypothetical protein
MARRYRKYRLDKGELVWLSEKMKKSKAVEYTVNSVMVRIRCGWKPAPASVLHQTLENEPEMYVACDFDRIGELVDEFKAFGSKTKERIIERSIFGHLFGWRGPLGVIAACAVDKNIDALKLFKNLLLRRLKASLVENIRLDRNAILKPFFCQLIAELLGDIASEI